MSVSGSKTRDNQDRRFLIQEDMLYCGGDVQWKILIVCIMLNLTAYRQVDKVIFEFFKHWKDPEDLARIPEWEEAQLLNLIRPMGLANRRAKSLVGMSQMFMKMRDEFGDDYEKYDIVALPGCSDYAQDAWKLFVLKQPAKPKDKQLRRYAIRVGLMIRDDDGENKDETAGDVS